MAHRQRHRLSRFSRHLKKKARLVAQGMHPRTWPGRLSGPRVLLNSLPKAGTHLLESALQQYPLMRNGGRRTLSCWDTAEARVVRALQRIRQGQFLNGHLTCLPEVSTVLEEGGVKVLFVVRDPRDIVVSHAKYVAEIDETHPMHKAYARLRTDEERIMASIVGLEGLRPPISEYLERFQGWLARPNVMRVRFEDLVGPEGGGSRADQEQTLNRIADFIGVSLTDRDIDRIARRTFSRRSSTFRKGSIGAWREVFSRDHVAAFDRTAGSYLCAYGYE